MRKRIDYTVQDEGRDKGKVFVINEMPARQAAHWAVKMMTALINAGFQVPEGMMTGGMASVAALGFDSVRKLQSADAIALMDELMKCVTIRRDPEKSNMSMHLLDDDIEEVSLYFKLAMEVFQLHTGFSTAAVRSTSTPDSKSAA